MQLINDNTGSFGIGTLTGLFLPFSASAALAAAGVALAPRATWCHGSLSGASGIISSPPTPLPLAALQKKQEGFVLCKLQRMLPSGTGKYSSHLLDKAGC